MKSKRSKATDISKKVKLIVNERDNGCCVICNKPGMPNSHYIKRSQGGLGIPENIVTMCLECHMVYDNGNNIEKKDYIKQKTKEYLQSKYENWNEKDLIYNKWRYL